MAGGAVKASVGEILTETLAIVRRQWVPVGIAAAAAGASQSLFEALAGQELGVLSNLVISVLFSYFFLEVLLRREGMLSSTWQGRKFGTYLGLGILAGIAIVFGSLLLIVPGLILAARWSLSTPYVVGESRSVTDAMETSWEATRDSQWAIIGVSLILVIALLIVAMAAGGLAVAFSMPLADPSSSFTLTFGLVSNIVTYAYTGVGLANTAALYRLLVVQGSELEAVFA